MRSLSSRIYILLFYCFTFLFYVNTLAFAVREIKIEAAVSSSFKKNPEWQKDIQERLQFANSFYEKQFGLHFSIKEFKSWEPQDETRALSLLIEELRAAFQLGPDEIVMGFHKLTKPLDKNVEEDMDTVGSAQYLRGFAVFRDLHQDLEQLYRNVIFAHELSHLFGAVHIADPLAIMNASLPNKPTTVLDQANQEIIQITKIVDFRKGEDSLSNQHLDNLIRIYEKMMSVNPHGDFYYQLGHFYEKRGLTARAVSTWEAAVREHYENPLIHRQLGLYYYHNNRFDSAIRELGIAVAHFILPSQAKDRALTFNLLGVAFYEKGNIDQAIFSWLKGLSSDPDSRDLQGNLALAYLQRGDIDRAISELQKLNSKYPDDVTTLSNLGAAYMSKKDSKKASEFFERALERKKATHEKDTDKNSISKASPEFLLHLNLGAAYLDQGRVQEGITQLEKSRSINSDNFEVHFNLAQAYLKTNAYEPAIKEIETALRYRKDDPYLYANLAQAYAHTGRNTEAVKTAREGIKFANGELKASLYRNIGAILAQEGKTSEAAVELKNAVNTFWNDAQSHTYLAMIYLETGKNEDAKRSLQNALRVDPKHEQAKKMLESLNQRNA